MRGLAVLLVVLYHVGLPVPGGFVGVDIFFVISGFVITGLLMRELQSGKTINFRNFYARRIRRLLPALALVILATILASFLLGSPFDRQQEVTALTGIGAILMAANAVIFFNTGEYFATPPTNNPLLNTWSLSVEEQFYLVFPIVLLLLWILGTRLTRRFRGSANTLLVTITVGLGALALGSFLLSVGMTYSFITWRFSDPDWFAFYASPTRAWEFAVGALVYLAFAIRPIQQRTALAMALVALGIFGMVASAFLITEATPFPGYVASIPVLATAAALAGGSLAPAWVRNPLATHPLTRLGDLSYSWYLWHWPLIAFAVLLFGEELPITITAALIALGFSVLTLRFVENPIRFRTSLPGVRASTIAVTCAGAVILAGSTLYVGARANWWHPELTSMNQQVSAVHLWQSTGCDTPTPLGQRGPACVWNPDGQGPPIYLLGDSMAGMLSEGALEAGRALGSPVLPATLGACPFINATLILEGKVETECESFVQESGAWLRESAEPGYVILASSFGYITMGAAELQSQLSGTVASSAESKNASYLQALGQTTAMLTAAGHQVHVLMPTPGFPQTLDAGWFWYPSQCPTIEALAAIENCGMTRSLADVVRETAELENQIHQTLIANGGIALQLRDAVCQDGVCATNFGNSWNYLDGTHITVDASKRLAPGLPAVFRSAPRP